MARHVFVLAFVAVSVPFAVARAQGTKAGGANASASVTQSAAPQTTETNPSMTTTASGRSATGYGYSDHAPAHHGGGRLQVRSGQRHTPTVPAQAGPIATLPGFEMLAEGGSRLFVELSQQVPVEERRARGTLTYVLHGAHVAVHNNTNPLVTVHFNTPVASARLVPAGHDLLFVVSLRANATPTWKVNPGKEGSSVLTVDFPKGTYLSGAATTQQQ